MHKVFYKKNEDSTCIDISNFMVNARNRGEDYSPGFKATGELTLERYDDLKAQYIVTEENFEGNYLENVYKHMISPQGFDLPKPNLIISVTGGAKNFTIDDEIKKAFKQVLMKVATNTNAWIITGGTDTGIMKLVGDAVKEDIAGCNQTLIGVASWNKVTYNEKETNEKNNKLYTLNPNHSCFILVDKPNGGKARGEIAFRTSLEKYIKDKESIPLILIVLEGGTGTLKTICGALENRFPILIIEKTKGCADLMKEIMKIKKEEKQEAIEEMVKVLKALKGSQNQENTNNSNKEESKKEKSKKDESKKDESEKDELRKDELKKDELKKEDLDLLETIWNNKKNLEHCINICELIGKETRPDIEKQIQEALSKVEDSPSSKIALAIKWNRPDIALSEFEKYKPKTNQTPSGEKMKENPEISFDEETIKVELEKLFILALVQNKPKFAELIMQNDMFKLNEFLTKKKLHDLYNNDNRNQRRIHNEPFYSYLQLKKLKKERRFIIFKSVCKKFDTDNPNGTIGFSDVKRFLKISFETIDTQFLPDNKEDADHVEEPELNLFLWCVLSNRIDTAKLFWQIGKNQISLALMASKILRTFASILTDDKSLFRKTASEFQTLAIQILDVFEENTRDAVNDVLVIRYLNFIQMDCLELAVNSKCRKFVSHSVPQVALENIWHGYDGKTNYNLTKYEKDLKKCQQNYNNNSNYILNNKRLREWNEKPNVWNSIVKFCIIPRVKFYLHLISYALFLMLFTFTMLHKSEYEKQAEQNTTIFSNDTLNNQSIESKKEDKNSNYMYTKEAILLVWIISTLIEEFRQFFLSNLKRYNLRFLIRNYVRNEWNILDFFGCILYIIGYIFLKNKHEISRIILGIDLALWYIRILQFFLRSSVIGPKLFMIRRMLGDLLQFLIVLATCLMAFGVALQAISEPSENINFATLFAIFNKAYWPIFGEIKLLEKLDVENCIKSENCEKLYTTVISYLLLMVYMIMASVLLLNLLIALFSSTYDKIEVTSDIVWKNQLYSLITEYVELPFFPPPLTFIPYFWFAIEALRAKFDLSNIEMKCSNQPDKTSNVLIDLERKCVDAILKKKVNYKLGSFDERFDLSFKRSISDSEMTNSDAINMFFQYFISNKIRMSNDAALDNFKSGEYKTVFEKLIKVLNIEDITTNNITDVVTRLLSYEKGNKTEK